MTDEEITRFLAETVMGWNTTLVELNDGHSFYELSRDGDKIWIVIIKDESGYLEESRRCWSPLTRWDHAGMLLPALQARCVALELSWHEATGWTMDLMWRDRLGGPFVTAAEGPRAISLAAVEAHRHGADVG